MVRSVNHLPPYRGVGHSLLHPADGVGVKVLIWAPNTEPFMSNVRLIKEMMLISVAPAQRFAVTEIRELVILRG